MRGLGFKTQRGTVFSRIYGTHVRKVHLQLVSRRKSPAVDLHLCIGFEQLRAWDALWTNRPVDEVATCHLSDSIGHLTPPFQFRILDVEDIESFSDTCIAEIRDTAMPWFERYGSLEAAIECWEGRLPYGTLNARIYAPLGRLCLGDVLGAELSARQFMSDLIAIGADSDSVAEQQGLVRFVGSPHS